MVDSSPLIILGKLECFDLFNGPLVRSNNDSRRRNQHVLFLPEDGRRSARKARRADGTSKRTPCACCK